MTAWQKFLRFVYPAYVRLSRVSKNKSRVLINRDTAPAVSFYTLQSELCDGSMLDFESFKGKKVLLANTASGCGFTEQFDQMQQLYKKYDGQLVVIAFPADDFGEEKANDEEIALFCKENFRVSFPLMRKSLVKKGKQQNKVFEWLTDPAKNGWNLQQPAWNFCKYLLDEKGQLIGYFGTAIEPIGKEIVSAIETT